MCNYYTCYCHTLQVGRHCLDSGLLKYSAKDHFFKALICIFCQQASDVQVCEVIVFGSTF